MRNYKVIYTAIIFMLIGGFTTLLALMAKGYTLSSPKSGPVTVEKTGWILIKSAPDGAKTYLNDNLSSPTNSSLGSLLPDTYNLRIQKEGYHEWKKALQVKAELVTIVNALLIKKAAEIKPITFTGVAQPSLDQTGTQIAYFAKGDEKTGLWVYTLEGSLFGTGRVNPRLIAEGQEFSSLKTIEWSPENSEVLVSLSSEGAQTRDILLSIEKPNLAPYVTINSTALREEWLQARKLTRSELIQAIKVPEQYAQIAADEKTTFSKDEKKFLYSTQKGNLTEHHVVNLTDPLPVGEQIDNIVYTQDTTNKDRVLWHTTSEHVLIVSGDTINIAEIDGLNRTAIFTTKLVDGLVVPTPNGRNIIINTSFTATALPNLHNIFFN